MRGPRRLHRVGPPHARTQPATADQQHPLSHSRLQVPHLASHVLGLIAWRIRPIGKPSMGIPSRRWKRSWTVRGSRERATEPPTGGSWARPAAVRAKTGRTAFAPPSKMCICIRSWPTSDGRCAHDRLRSSLSDLLERSRIGGANAL